LREIEVVACVMIVSSPLARAREFERCRRLKRTLMLAWTRWRYVNARRVSAYVYRKLFKMTPLVELDYFLKLFSSSRLDS